MGWKVNAVYLPKEDYGNRIFHLLELSGKTSCGLNTDIVEFHSKWNSAYHVSVSKINCKNCLKTKGRWKLHLETKKEDNDYDGRSTI